MCPCLVHTHTHTNMSYICVTMLLYCTDLQAWSYMFLPCAHIQTSQPWPTRCFSSKSINKSGGLRHLLPCHASSCQLSSPQCTPCMCGLWGTCPVTCQEFGAQHPGVTGVPQIELPGSTSENNKMSSSQHCRMLSFCMPCGTSCLLCSCLIHAVNVAYRSECKVRL